jgi:putative chitinase
MNIDNLQGNIPDIIFNQLQTVIDDFEINTELRLAHFISQCAHESTNFTRFTENLNYSASGLLRVFPKYFPDGLELEYERQPEKIANHVYCDRMGNGDEDSGDGWNYRGRGCIQLTGFNNYQSLSDDLNVDFVNDPDLVANDYSLISAAWFFYNNKLLNICDRGSDVKTITSLTKRINGGTTNLSDRIDKFNKYYVLINE